MLRPSKIRRFAFLLFVAVSFGLGLFNTSAQAQSRGAGAPGVFDYYVLALSWSPSYCATDGQNDTGPQCTSGRPYSFIVHGLWPQYERGWPEFCAGPERVRVKRSTISQVFDLMPSPGLIRHTWNKHGTCSGLDERLYFETLREAREAVRIPPAFAGIDRAVTVDPEAVETAFRTANPGLPPDAIHVTCGRRFLREVRICMTKSLHFRSCDELERRTCQKTSVVLPPVR